MNRVRTVLITLVLGGATLGAGACNRTPADAQHDAIEAQNSANQKIEEAQKTASQDVSEAQRKQNEDMAELNRKANDTTQDTQKKIDEAKQNERHEVSEAQANANEKIRAANVDVKGDSSDLRVWGQKRVDELSNAIDAATVKAQKAAPQARSYFDTQIKDVRAGRDQLASEVSTLDQAAIRDAAAFRNRVENRVDQLKQRVDKLEQHL
jgi:hypothetical protein